MTHFRARAADIVRAAAGAARRFALPASCLGCGAPVDVELLCDNCLTLLVPRLRAMRLPTTHEPRDAHYALILDGPSRALVHALKFEQVTRAAELLAERATPVARLTGAGSCDVAVAVPLHATRRRERGYNQSLVLATALSRRLGPEVLEGALMRRRPTCSQTGLDRPGRLRNVRGAFAAAPEKVAGRRVLLIDDVVTTGATLAEASDALLRAGAAGVAAFAAAGRPETG